jgi:glycosyltransferase involved in cell wall biosynthesis
MRILLLAPQYPPTLGGAELQAQRMAYELNTLGVRVTVLTQPLAGQDAEQDDKGVRVVRRLGSVPLGPLFGLTFMANTQRWMRRLGGDWDLVHNQQVGLHSWASLRTAQAFNKPCLLRFASSGSGGDLATLRARRFGDKFVGALRDAHRYIALTQGAAAEIAQFGLPADKTRVIPNGIDLTKFAAQDWPTVRGSDPIRLLFVGRLGREKGIDVLLDALASLPRPSEFTLKIVGFGGELQKLEAQVRALGLQQIVEFCGRRIDMAAEYAWSEIVVLPSRFEGMPNVVLEAMACARPVLGTRIDGTRDLVQEPASGWLVPPEDVKALAAALANVSRQRQNLRAMGAVGREIVERRFALSDVAGQYLKEYEALLASKRGSG